LWLLLPLAFPPHGMSLPPLIRYIYNHGSDEVIRRGKRIFHTAGVQLQDVDQLHDVVRFRVRNDQFYNHYTVTVQNASQPAQVSLRCQCPYNLGDICRHEVAALYLLNDMVQSGFFQGNKPRYNQKETAIRIKDVSESLIAIYCSPQALEWARKLADESGAQITQTASDTLQGLVPDGDTTMEVRLQHSEERYYHTSCQCNESAFPLCRHKAVVFLQTLKEKGAGFFQQLKNYEVLKNKLLAQYGYSLKDDLTGKFDFVTQQGKMVLRVLDPSIRKKEETHTTGTGKATETEAASGEEPLALIVDFPTTIYPFVGWRLLTGQLNTAGTGFTGKTQPLELQQYINANRFSTETRDLLPAVRKLHHQEIVKFLKKSLAYGDLLENYTLLFKNQEAPEAHELLWEYLLPKYHKLLAQYATHPLLFLNRIRDNKGSMKPVQFAAMPARPVIKAIKETDGVLLSLSFWLEGQRIDYADVEVLNGGLLLWDNTLFATDKVKNVLAISQLLPGGRLKVSEAAWSSFLAEKAILWRQYLELELDKALLVQDEDQIPKRRLYVQEKEQKLMLQPAFVYGDEEVKWGQAGDVLRPVDGRLHITIRDGAEEQNFIRELRHLHSDMREISIGKYQYFYLPAATVFRDNWYFRFLEWTEEKNVALLGWENLEQLRINRHPPKTNLQISSGIDWFDATMEVFFGEQQVHLSDIKKALSHRKNYVRLPDGSLGYLPDEWQQKYGLLLKIGQIRGHAIRLRKMQFSALEPLEKDLHDEASLQEIEKRRRSLARALDQDFSRLQAAEGLEEKLRPYQRAGFQWQAFLAEAGWGGILADDMGLGKTVQSLAWLQRYKRDHPNSRFMVVCPTSLAFNWEAEVKKFTPDISYHIHHGPKRSTIAPEFKNADLIITTYGTMRSDIALLKEINFSYVVLDESQSIKNPQSQAAKAAYQLNATHRLCLSGTPVQNNTFDLYSQMNFLNPGLLGSREFFANEFAAPIDKLGDKVTQEQLRRLCYPFILRRSKEQVAQDLPPKTEAILYCDMGTEQRKIYDSYRNNYRSELLGMIDTKGMRGAQFHVLQGLTRLRQICDSPALLHAEDNMPQDSVKLDELLREITENIGQHKALVFSQFLGMLALLKGAFQKANIPYAYFDGGTSITEREKAIQSFQNDEECRAFLISLKAGGIGLNLTAADYVYIVDPWWNPAVEQQAIDRAHRIGQTKSVIAYRLICKDTIEEKMLILQERKRELAASLVTDDTALLKSLSRDDVAFLLS